MGSPHSHFVVNFPNIDKALWIILRFSSSQAVKPWAETWMFSEQMLINFFS